jgi:hypothetical protein
MALELLLRLHADPTQEWTALELSRELRAGPEWTAQELRDFTKRELVAATDVQSPRFRYAPRSPELDNAVAKLAASYPRLRFSIIQIIYSEPIKDFADAFKLRKD